MTSDLFSLREQEIFHALKDLSSHHFVIIGGYAVNAYSLPRFSVDCDIVIQDKKELAGIEKKLLNTGYKKEQHKKQISPPEGFLRYEKQLKNKFMVSFDIMVGRVNDRMTGVDFSADWIFNNSDIRKLQGKTIGEGLYLRIITIEALIVMKMISCRATDIRDIFMLMPAAKEKEWMRREISQRYSFYDRFAKIIEKVTSKQFKDGLSGVYGSLDQKAFEKHVKAILAFKE